VSDTATTAPVQILQNPQGATPAPATNTPPPMIGNLPVPPGWAIAIGCIGLIMVAGTRFGGIAAGIGGVAVIYQLGGWIVEATQPAAQTGTVV
jgi:hypothetical protein